MIVLTIVFVLALTAVIFMLVGMKAKPRLAVEKYQTRWLAIENSFMRDNPASWQLAVMNADRLLDQALRESRVKGTTMGERMKSAQSIWKNANHVWSAHKIRNQLAHEADAKVSYDTAARSLAAFKQGLKDLGAI